MRFYGQRRESAVSYTHLHGRTPNVFNPPNRPPYIIIGNEYFETIVMSLKSDSTILYASKYIVHMYLKSQIIQRPIRLHERITSVSYTHLAASADICARVP